jgi:hypothetical protein
MTRRRRRSKAELRREQMIEELVQITIARGITSEEMAPHVLACNVRLIGDAGPPRAEKINAAGRVAQLHCLEASWGVKKLRRELAKMGSELDGFVQGFSSDPRDVERDIGRHNVNEYGDVE